MHHKFALVDGSQLVNGSFNWTRHAIAGNSENVVITRCQRLVAAFSAEFDRLWALYDPTTAVKPL